MTETLVAYGSTAAMAAHSDRTALMMALAELRQVAQDYEELRATTLALVAACEAALPIVTLLIEYDGDPCQKVARGLADIIAKSKEVLNG